MKVKTNIAKINKDVNNKKKFYEESLMKKYNSKGKYKILD